ncbi:MAG TPA: Hsp20/alpha crystallin family protein [Anaeromyxobacteraceae bacterium]|nr:Hsp20/alpha crystallin family protein [Anaeromyxobacteraceae bacterium]
MARETAPEIQKAEKAGVLAGPEPTCPGPMCVPSVDIFENDNSIALLADMPGVKPGDLKIDLRESVLTLVGRVSAPESARESDVLREHQPGMFFRQFTLAEAIDQARIDAKLTDGVLRLELPKIDAARPRRIAVIAQ